MGKERQGRRETIVQKMSKADENSISTFLQKINCRRVFLHWRVKSPVCLRVETKMTESQKYETEYH